MSSKKPWLDFEACQNLLTGKEMNESEAKQSNVSLHECAFI